MNETTDFIDYNRRKIKHLGFYRQFQGGDVREVYRVFVNGEAINMIDIIKGTYLIYKPGQDSRLVACRLVRISKKDLRKTISVLKKAVKSLEEALETK